MTPLPDSHSTPSVASTSANLWSELVWTTPPSSTVLPPAHFLPQLCALPIRTSALKLFKAPCPCPSSVFLSGRTSFPRSHLHLQLLNFSRPNSSIFQPPLEFFPPTLQHPLSFPQSPLAFNFLTVRQTFPHHRSNTLPDEAKQVLQSSTFQHSPKFLSPTDETQVLRRNEQPPNHSRLKTTSLFVEPFLTPSNTSRDDTKQVLRRNKHKAASPPSVSSNSRRYQPTLRIACPAHVISRLASRSLYLYAPGPAYLCAGAVWLTDSKKGVL